MSEDFVYALINILKKDSTLWKRILKKKSHTHTLVIIARILQKFQLYEEAVIKHS